MKKSIILLSVLCFCIAIPLNTYADGRHPKPSNVLDKDNGEGSRINIGFSFAPTLDWMNPHTEGYERDGVNMGYKFGFPININLTHKKSYYVSTGIFFEQLGGKMVFVDNLPITDRITFDSTETQRRYRSNYLTIPIGITLKSKSINNFYICGNVGLYNSFCLKSYNYDSYTIDNELWTRQRTLSEETAVIKESFFVGLGVEYSITKDFRAGFYINYANTFTNYFKGRGLAKNDLTGLDQKAKIGCVEFVLNINFF